MDRWGERTAPYSAMTPPVSASIHGLQLAVGALSWGAVFAGGAAAAALSFILLMLGSGLGLSVLTPWVNDGAYANASGAFGISSIAWLTLTQMFASGLGGYLAGRLRAKWVGACSDEVFFRDTAHGFLAWCIASLLTAAMLTTVAAQAGRGLADAAAMAATSGASAASVRPDSGNLPYFIDTLFRREGAGKSAIAATSATVPATEAGTHASVSSPANGNANTNSQQANAEVARIFSNALGAGILSPEDQHYVGRLIAPRAALSQADAETRVRGTFARLQARLIASKNANKEMAYQLRKVSAQAALWLFISLLVGALIASLTATLGGQQRDF